MTGHKEKKFSCVFLLWSVMFVLHRAHFSTITFLIYINDLFNYSSNRDSSVIQFADDTSVLISHKNLDNTIAITTSLSSKKGC